MGGGAHSTGAGSASPRTCPTSMLSPDDDRTLMAAAFSGVEPGV